MRLLTASLRKLALRPASRITLLVLAALLVLIYAAVGASAVAITDQDQRLGIEAIVRFPAAYGNLASLLGTFAGLGAAAWAGAVAGTEWSWNTFRLAVARGESRPRYVLVTFAAAALLLVVAWVVLFAVGIAAALIGGAIGGVAPGEPLDPAGLSTVPFAFIAGWWATVLSAAIGFAVAFISRSQVAGIIAVVGLYFGEQFAAIVIPQEILRLAPISASAGLAAEASRAGLSGDLAVPFLLTSAYIALAALAMSAYARRAEIA